MDANGYLQRCEVILDTGFTGWLMLPEADIERLGLVSEGERQGILASGLEDTFEYYESRVEWHGHLDPVEILLSIDQPLLGMELLEGSRVTVEAWDSGDVIIEEA